MNEFKYNRNYKALIVMTDNISQFEKLMTSPLIFFFTSLFYKGRVISPCTCGQIT